VVSPTFPLARDTTMQTLEELLDGRSRVPGTSIEWMYHGTQRTFHIKMRDAGQERHGRIRIYTAERPERLKGPNLAAACIDEPFIMPYEVFQQMVARVRHPKAKLREMNLTGTPEQLNWGYDLCEGELRDKFDVGLVQASTTENLALPKEYLGQVGSAYADEKQQDAYIHGKFVNLSIGQVYYGFNQERNVIDRGKELPMGAEWIAGMDFNVNPMAFALGWHLRREKRIHWLREFEIPNSDTEYAAGELREACPQLIEIYPDPSGRNRSTSSSGGITDFHHLERGGFMVNAIKGTYAIRDRYNRMNDMLKGGTLTVDPSCRRMIKYLRFYTHEGKLKPEQEAMSHLLDAVGYPAINLYPAIPRGIHAHGVL
jgi:hypothetical protein